MALKNKEINKLFDAVELYFDSWCLPPLSTAFMDCDDAIEGEIAAIKDELTDAKRGRAIFRADADHLRNIVLEKDDELRTANDEIESLKKTIDELKEKLNIERKHGEELADVNRQLASENADLKAKTGQLRLLEHSRIIWRSRAQHAEKEVEDLNKKIHELEEENANLRVTPDDAIRVKSLERANKILRRDNEALWAKLEERDLDISKRPWHGDCNAMTDTRTCHKSLVETIEDLKAKKARLEENVDLSYGHEFEFGDEVFVPWSCDPYMYIKSGQLYNPRTERLVYVGKDQHLKWFGEKFSIV